MVRISLAAAFIYLSTLAGFSQTISDSSAYRPVRGIKSVTIICPRAEIADAMATPVMVMGIKAGLDLINQIKDMACLIIDDEDRLNKSNKINLCWNEKVLHYSFFMCSCLFNYELFPC